MSSSNIFGLASRVMVMAIVISVILLFVGIGVLVLIHVCIVGRAFRRGMDAGNLVEGRDQTIRRNYSTMSKDELEKLPVFEFKVAEKGSSPVDCVVCLENFKMGDKCRLLPICKHSFHAECIDSWLIKTPICPICRTGAGAWKGSTVLGSGGTSSGMVRIELRENQSRNEIVSISSPLHNSPAEHVV